MYFGWADGGVGGAEEEFKGFVVLLHSLERSGTQTRALRMGEGKRNKDGYAS